MTRAAAAAGWAGVPDSIALGDTPPYPLARLVPMPAGHAYPHGALAFRLASLTVAGLGAARVSARADGGTAIAWRTLALSGEYRLEAKPDPLPTIDSGGDLMEVDPARIEPGVGGGNEDGFTLDPDKEEWLDQARGQREQLRATANGQKLLDVYAAHNETLEEVFRTNGALPPLWKAGGATRAMAADTSVAVDKDDILNHPTKTYVGGVTYNANAFVQQLNVAAACLFTDPGFDPETGPPPGSRYWDAAKATLSFGSTVTSKTGNSKQAVNALKPSDVHDHVQAHDGDLDPVGDDAVAALLMEAGPGGRDGAAGAGGLLIDEEDRARLRGLYEATMRQRAEDATTGGVPLHRGRCAAVLRGVEALVAPPAAPGAPPAVTVDLPAFALDVDDADWAGEAGRVARRRLESMYFIRSLLHRLIADALAAAVARGAAPGPARDGGARG